MGSTKLEQLRPRARVEGVRGAKVTSGVDLFSLVFFVLLIVLLDAPIPYLFFSFLFNIRIVAKGQSLEQGFQVELVRAKAIARGYGSIVAEDEQGYSNGLVELQKHKVGGWGGRGAKNYSR